MAGNKISTKEFIIAIVTGTILGLLGLLQIFFPNENELDFASPIVYTAAAAIVFAIFAMRSRKQPVSSIIWITFVIFGIIFPICIPFTFISLGKLQGYSMANKQSSSGGANGGNYSSGNYSGTASGVVPRGGSRFGGGGASSTEPEVTEDAFGQSKSSGAPTSSGPRFARTTMDEPAQRSLHERIADLDSDETITISLSDGRLFSFNTLAIIILDDDTYCVVQAAEALEDIPVGMMGVFKFIWGDDGEELVISVDDDETIERVEAEFQRLLEENGVN